MLVDKSQAIFDSVLCRKHYAKHRPGHASSTRDIYNMLSYISYMPNGRLAKRMITQKEDDGERTTCVVVNDK